ncbi:hypothetical protein, partial [Streptomyces phaeochromogenes]
SHEPRRGHAAGDRDDLRRLRLLAVLLGDVCETLAGSGVRDTCSRRERGAACAAATPILVWP